MRPAAGAPSSSSGPRRILVLSGPNLELLGVREPHIYGSETLENHVSRAASAAEQLGWRIDHVQSNHEGDLVDAVSAAHHDVDALVVNAGALTHYSWALRDSLAAFPGPVVELHLSNPAAREPWRRASVVSEVADAVICGLGGAGYRVAVEAVAELLHDPAPE